MTDPTTAADRPEVDDPRVLALAKARQQIAYESPFNFVCPPWEGLSEQEQHLSLLDARNYLRAALKAGLVPAVVPSVDRAALRDRIAERPERYAVAIHDAMESDLSLVDQEPGQQALFARAAEAVMALADSEQATLRRKLAAAEKIRENADFHLGQEMARRQLAEKEAARLSADQAAVLNAAAQHLYTALFPAVYDDMGQKAAEGVQRAVSELRRLAVEAQQQPDPGTCGHRSPEGHLCGRDPGHYGYHRHVAREGGWYSWLGELATAAGVGQDGAQPFIPPTHYRRDDGVDCCVHTIPVGPDSCRECRDLDDTEAPS